MNMPLSKFLFCLFLPGPTSYSLDCLFSTLIQIPTVAQSHGQIVDSHLQHHDSLVGGCLCPKPRQSQPLLWLCPSANSCQWSHCQWNLWRHQIPEFFAHFSSWWNHCKFVSGPALFLILNTDTKFKYRFGYGVLGSTRTMLWCMPQCFEKACNV